MRRYRIRCIIHIVEAGEIKGQNATETDALSAARRALEIEGRAVLALADQIGEPFLSAVAAILETRGRVIIAGMGKSGHIGRKIAASLSSTGTPSVFLHPAEGFHGDLGIITKDDVVIAISNSG